MTYAGIGSRSTPEHLLPRITELARQLDELGYTLRSGGARGADTAFALGATRKEIFIPWRGFAGLLEDKKECFYCRKPEARQIAMAHHPAWFALTEPGRTLQTRNVCQILGYNLDDPVKFVLYWAELDGYGAVHGGTAQAIRIANSYGIPTIHIESMSDTEILAYAKANMGT